MRTNHMMQKRHQEILSLLHEEGSVQVKDLTERFAVSIETVRRDLEAMEKKGLIRRVYGGAIPLHEAATEPLYEKRQVRHIREKEAIGRLAASLVEDGDTLAIDLGTTTLELAKALVGQKKVTVLTNSILIAAHLSADPAIRVIICGGVVRGGDLSVSGLMAAREMDQFTTDKFFLGVGALTPEEGVMDYHLEESNLRRILIRNTRRVIALADFSKFGAVAMNRVCPLSELTDLVTDEKTEPAFREAIARRGVTVHVAHPEKEPK